MKKVIFVLSFIAFAFTAKSQEYLTGYVTDTLANAETIYLYVGGTQTAAGASKITEYGVLNLVLVSDSLSGSTNVAASIEYSVDALGTNWYTAASLSTLNGAASQTQITEDAVFAARKARIKLVGTGTQSTRVRLHYCFKGAN